MEKLYEDYGRLVIQAEIIQNQINQIKQKIAQELNKKPEVKEAEPVKE